MRILLAVNDSPHSAEAVKEVAKRTWPEDTIVRVLNAVEKVVLPAGDIWVAVDHECWEEDTRRAAEILSRSVQTLQSSGLVAEHAMREGNPREAIVAEAMEWRADLIVVGSRSRKQLRRLFWPTVDQVVVNRAPCPVEVVPLRMN